MNKIVKKLASLLIISGLLLAPVLNLLFIPEIGAKVKSGREAASIQNSAVVAVIDKVASPEVVPVSAVSLAAGACKSPSILNGNLIQDTAQINLNQPANCFSLVQTQILAQANLRVVSLANQAVKIVAQSKNFTLTPWAYSPFSAPLTVPNSALPLAALVIFIGVLLKLKARGIIQSKVNQHLSFSLKTFQVLRC